jgi:integrase
MEWRFDVDESKTKKLRILRIKDSEIIDITRRQMERHPDGPIFRALSGEPWTRKNLSQRFRFLKYRLQKEGLEFDDDCCIYSCRHTYAKRTLEGYWTGRPCNIETLARLMGNSPQVCQEHYLQWSTVDNEFLWENA